MAQGEPSKGRRAPKRPHQKVKSGCKTCKIRRVKCDEGYPACFRCISVGRECPGYGIWGGGGFEYKGPSKPTPALERDEGRTLGGLTALPPKTARDTLRSSLLLFTGSPMAPGPQLSVEEQFYLEYFVYGTSIKQPRIMGSYFWEPEIMKAAVSEPMILNAILALAASHKRQDEDPFNRAREDQPPDALEIFQLQQYTRGMRAFRDKLTEECTSSSSSKSRKWTITIMCCLLAILEYMRGRHKEGAFHLGVGLKLAKVLFSDKGYKERSTKMLQFFARFQDQATVFWFRLQEAQSGVPLSSRPATADLATVVQSRLKFICLEEAQHYLNSLMDITDHCIEIAQRIPDEAQAARLIAKHERAYLLGCYEAWSLAFRKTMTTVKTNAFKKEKPLWVTLGQRHEVAHTIAKSKMTQLDNEFEVSCRPGVGSVEELTIPDAYSPSAGSSVYSDDLTAVEVERVMNIVPLYERLEEIV